MPRVRGHAKDFSDEEDRVVLVEFDEFHKRVIRHQVCGIFWGRGHFSHGGYRGVGRRFGASSAAPAAKAKGGVALAAASDRSPKLSTGADRIVSH